MNKKILISILIVVLIVTVASLVIFIIKDDTVPTIADEVTNDIDILGTWSAVRIFEDGEEESLYWWMLTGVNNFHRITFNEDLTFERVLVRGNVTQIDEAGTYAVLGNTIVLTNEDNFTVTINIIEDENGIELQLVENDRVTIGFIMLENMFEYFDLITPQYDTSTDENTEDTISNGEITEQPTIPGNSTTGTSSSSVNNNNPPSSNNNNNSSGSNAGANIPPPTTPNQPTVPQPQPEAPRQPVVEIRRSQREIDRLRNYINNNPSEPMLENGFTIVEDASITRHNKLVYVLCI
jgi:hypothetical protein